MPFEEDDAFDQLDPDLKGRTLDLLAGVQERTRIPMIFISHAPEEVRRLCDRVICLSQGKASAVEEDRWAVLADACDGTRRDALPQPARRRHL